MRPMHRSLAALLFLAVTFLPGAARAQDLTCANRRAVERFPAAIQSDVEQDGIGGITAGVMMGDRLVWAKGFGWADPVREVPAEVETIYRTGSISKSFTAVLLMKLVERATVELDDPVERYLPEIAGLAERPEDAPPITFRQLASHTAGLTREPRLRNAAVGPIEQWEEKILASIPKTAYQARPGEAYSYSNIGFGILGLALSRAAGRPFMHLMREMVFDPLELSSSFFVLTPELSQRMSVGHANWEQTGEGAVNTELPEREHDGRGYKVPNGGIYSTVRDLGRFAAAMYGAHHHQLLPEDLRREMMTIQTPESEERGYGLGFSVRIQNGHRLVSHGGSVAGYNAYLVFDPDRQVAVVILRNYNRGRTNLGRAASALLTELVSSQSR